MQLVQELDPGTIERLQKQGKFLARTYQAERPGPDQPSHGIFAQQFDCSAAYGQADVRKGRCAKHGQPQLRHRRTANPRWAKFRAAKKAKHVTSISPLVGPCGWPLVFVISLFFRATAPYFDSCAHDSPRQRTACQEEYLAGDFYSSGGENANGKNRHDVRDDDAKIEGRNSNVS